MFSVYGAAGRLFRGSLEQMRQISPVRAVDHSRAIDALKRDGRDSALREMLESGSGAAHHKATQREGLAAYAPIRPPVGQRWSVGPVALVMAREVFSVDDGATVLQAWQLMDEHGIGQAPVLNAEAMLVGMVIRASLLRIEAAGGAQGAGRRALAWLERNVAEAMLSPVPSVAADTPLGRVASLLLESGLPGVPVVDEAGRVTGFVSRTDVLRAALADTALDHWA